LGRLGVGVGERQIAGEIDLPQGGARLGSGEIGLGRRGPRRALAAQFQRLLDRQSGLGAVEVLVGTGPGGVLDHQAKGRVGASGGLRGLALGDSRLGGPERQARRGGLGLFQQGLEGRCGLGRDGRAKQAGSGAGPQSGVGGRTQRPSDR
jgi:hypothetical protein